MITGSLYLDVLLFIELCCFIGAGVVAGSLVGFYLDLSCGGCYVEAR